MESGFHHVVYIFLSLINPGQKYWDSIFSLTCELEHEYKNSHVFFIIMKSVHDTIAGL